MNKENTQRVKILVADDDPTQLPYIITSLIDCNDDTISQKDRFEIVMQCFDLKFTDTFLEVERMVNNKRNPFIPHIALLDVNFEKNSKLLKKKNVDLRYKGIELAELIKTKGNGFSKVILNTGFSEHEQWKEMFRKKGYVVKSDYAEDDPENTIYRKEKRGDKGTDALTHLVRPILHHFAVETYRCLDAPSKKKITLITDGIKTKHRGSQQVDEVLQQLPVTGKNLAYTFGDLFYFNAEIIRSDGVVKIGHSGISDHIPGLISDARVTSLGAFPFLNGPWKTEEIQQGFVSYISEDMPEKIRLLEEKVIELVMGFYVPLLSKEKMRYVTHDYARNYTLVRFQKNPSKVESMPTHFVEAMRNNVIVRISAVLAANVCTEQRLYLTVPGKIDALRLHRKAFKIYIDQNPPFIKLTPDDWEDHKHVSSFIVGRLGLSCNEKEEDYQVSDLCDPEREVYYKCHTRITAEVKKNISSR